jgi:hypothetical protein
MGARSERLTATPCTFDPTGLLSTLLVHPHCHVDEWDHAVMLSVTPSCRADQMKSGRREVDSHLVKALGPHPGPHAIDLRAGVAGWQHTCTSL